MAGQQTTRVSLKAIWDEIVRAYSSPYEIAEDAKRPLTAFYELFIKGAGLFFKGEFRKSGRHILDGLTQLVKWPLAWLIKAPLQGFLTLFNLGFSTRGKYVKLKQAQDAANDSQREYYRAYGAAPDNDLDLWRELANSSSQPTTRRQLEAQEAVKATAQRVLSLWNDFSKRSQEINNLVQPSKENLIQALDNDLNAINPAQRSTSQSDGQPAQRVNETTAPSASSSENHEPQVSQQQTQSAANQDHKAQQEQSATSQTDEKAQQANNENSSQQSRVYPNPPQEDHQNDDPAIHQINEAKNWLSNEQTDLKQDLQYAPLASRFISFWRENNQPDVQEKVDEKQPIVQSLSKK